jgi:mannan endo-1,6-alpha-mannosidase
VSRVRPDHGHRLYVFQPFQLPLFIQNTNTAPGFRPPSQLNLAPNDLEAYNVRNDGWCLVTLALILVSFTNAVPFTSAPATKLTSIPYAKAVVAATVFHHITTGIGAYQHYKLPSHYNTSMSIGVWGNVWLTLTGLFTLAILQSDKGNVPVEEVAKKAR